MGRKSDSRQQLLDAAHALIWSCSYGAVTIEAICSRAGVKKGSFYYFFDSKSDLAIVAITEWWAEKWAVLGEFFRPEVPPVDRIVKYIDFACQYLIQEHEKSGQVLGCPFFTLGSEICTQDERLRALVQGILAQISGSFEQAIRDAQASGDLEGTDAGVKARMLWAFYAGTLTRARIENNPDLLRTLAADALELIGAHPKLAQVA